MLQTRETDSAQEEILSSFRQERLEQRRKKPAILIGVSIGVVIAVCVGGLTFGKYGSVYYNTDGGELPVIHAERSADARKPDEPGGMEIPYRDMLVYERLRQNSGDLPVERLLPAVEKPVPPEESVIEKEEDPIGDLAANIIAREVASAAAVIYEDDGTPVEVIFKEPEPVAVKQEASEKRAEPEGVEPTQKKPVVSEEKVIYSVQLVSARSESAAESEWKRLVKKFKELIADRPHFISKTAVANGTFYRLRVGRFEKHEDAKALCEQLKTKKQECFVVK